MPQFVMPVGDVPTDFYALNPFVRGYIEAMFFTEEEELGDAAYSDLTDHSLAKAVGMCVIFQRQNEGALQEAYETTKCAYGPEEAGRDLWLTSQGHGVGFWDRGLGPIGDMLSDATERFEVYVYRGDDGKVYLV